jgi:hypothetical protein
MSNDVLMIYAAHGVHEASAPLCSLYVHSICSDSTLCSLSSALDLHSILDTCHALDLLCVLLTYTRLTVRCLMISRARGIPPPPPPFSFVLLCTSFTFLSCCFLTHVLPSTRPPHAFASGGGSLTLTLTMRRAQAHAEVLIREVMNVDNVTWEVANETVQEIAVTCLPQR